jgi:hypothetical protein
METRMMKERTVELQRSLGFPNGEIVATTGLSRGLALFWRTDMLVALQSKSRSHIDVVISCDILRTKQWRFRGFMGNPEENGGRTVGT